MSEMSPSGDAMLGEDDDGRFDDIDDTHMPLHSDPLYGMGDFADAEAETSLMHDAHDAPHDGEPTYDPTDPTQQLLGDDDLHAEGAYDRYSGDDDDIPIGDRLYLKGQEVLRRRQEKLEKAQADLAAKEMRENMEKPHICPSSNVRRSDGDFNKFYKLQEDWLHRKNRILDKKRDMEVEEDLKVDRQVRASRKSNKILAGRHRGPMQAWQEREQQFRASHTEEKVAGAPFKPTISPAAQQLRRKGDVTSRLYDTARHKKPAEECDASKAATKKISDDEMKVLLRKMAIREANAKRKFEAKKSSLREEEGTFQPKVNERSSKILDRQGGHVPIHVRSKAGRAHQQKEQQARSASPPPNRHASHSHAPPAQPNIWKKAAASQQKLNARLESLREEREQEESAACTFRPETNRRSAVLVSRGQLNRAQVPVSEGDEVFWEDDTVVRGGPTLDDGAYTATGSHASPEWGQRHHHAAPSHYDTPDELVDPDAGSGNGVPQHSTAYPETSHPSQGQSEFTEWEASWLRQQDEISSILRQYSAGSPSAEGVGGSGDTAPSRRVVPPPSMGGGADPDPTPPARRSYAAPDLLPHVDYFHPAEGGAPSLQPSGGQYAAAGVGPPTPAATPPVTRTLDPDVSFSKWEEEWLQQQGEIKAILTQCGPAGGGSGSARREGGGGGGGGGGGPIGGVPVAAPGVGRGPVAHGVPARGGGSGVVRGGGGGVGPGPALHHAPPLPREAVPAAAAHPDAAPVQDCVSDLQSVLDGWRQLEDQFSTSFEKLRLQ